MFVLIIRNWDVDGANMVFALIWQNYILIAWCLGGELAFILALPYFEVVFWQLPRWNSNFDFQRQ